MDTRCHPLMFQRAFFSCCLAAAFFLIICSRLSAFIIELILADDDWPDAEDVLEPEADVDVALAECLELLLLLLED